VIFIHGNGKVMNNITLKAHAKINLTLDIVGKRPDGYHNIKSIMQSIELHDIVYICRRANIKAPAIALECTNPALPTDNRNIAYRVADYMMKTYGLAEDLHIKIEKNIPIEAGLGGGSADAAAVLIGIRDLYRLPLDNTQLAEIGKQFGADVPFCIYGGTMMAEGIGDILTPLPAFSETYVLLAKPTWGFSTKEMYKKHNDSFKKLETENAFENIEIAGMDMIHEIKAAMLEKGATKSLMSGAGSVVFGLFEDTNVLKSAAESMKLNYTDLTFITTKTIDLS